MKKAIWLLAALAAPGAMAAYKCVDERGITLIGDIPPAGCAKVVMYEVSRSGMVLRSIPPSLTPEQAKAKREEEARRKEAERAAARQKRKDLALLNTYATQNEIDVARDRNIEPVQVRIAGARERLQELEAQERKALERMSPAADGRSRGARQAAPAPSPALAADLARVRSEKASMQKALAGYAREVDEIRARYDADKRRWMALKSGEAKVPEAGPKTANRGY